MNDEAVVRSDGGTAGIQKGARGVKGTSFPGA